MIGKIIGTQTTVSERTAGIDAVDDLIAKAFLNLEPVNYLVVMNKALKVPALKSSSDDIVVKEAVVGHNIQSMFGSADDLGCIINEPESTMSIPLLGLDIARSAAILVKSATETPPSAKGKPLYAVVRGAGTGKTRFFEEIRRNILTTAPGVLCIAVTFNNKTPLGDAETRWKSPSDVDSELFHSLVAVSRMATSFFGVGFKDITDRIDGALELLRSLQLPDTDIPRDILRSFVSSILMRMSSEDCQVHSCVFLIDETMAVGDSGRFVSLLSRSLLNDYVYPNLGISLAVSTLDLSAVGKTCISKRVVIPLLLAEQLDVNRVIQDIWGLDSISDSKDMLKLMLFATTVNRIPRLVEIVRSFTINHNTTTIDAAFLDTMFATLHKGWSERYSDYSLSEPLIDTICDAITTTDGTVTVSKSISLAIKVSLLTNQINLHRPTDDLEADFEYFVIPKISIMMLYYFMHETRHLIGYPFPRGTALLDAVLKSVSSVLGFVRNPPSSGDKIGLISETVFREWLLVRLTSVSHLQRHCGKTFTTANIIGLHSGSDSICQLKAMYPDLNRLFIENIDVSLNCNTVHQMSCTSYSNEIAFLDELEAVTSRLEGAEDEEMLLEEQGVVVIMPSSNNPSEQEAWDICLKVFYTGATKGTTYIFFDNKSFGVKEQISLTTVSGLTQMPKAGSQYTHTKDVADKRKLSFLYIYATTYHVESFAYGRAIELGVREMSCFLGPMYELYTIPRSQS